MRKLIVIKLGGSVVTFKDSSTPKARISVVNRLAKEIKQILDTNKYQLILVHGAGSFGHPLARKNNLQNGMKNQDQKLGLGLTDQQMVELNSIIVSSLLKNQMPAVGLSPRSFIKQTAGKLKSFSTSVIKTFLKQNIIPVLHGDVVLDDRWGCSIVSGDAIVSYLAKKLKAAKVIFLSDVEGIYTLDPKKNPKVALIPEITRENFHQVLKGLDSNHDITGGMRGKILQIWKNLNGIPVYLASGFKQQALIAAVRLNQAGTRLLVH